MAYQDLIFNNLAGKVIGIYNDNNLLRDVNLPEISNRRIIATGTATAGARNELFDVRSINTAMETFGSDSEIATIIQQVANINTDFNLSVVRVGSSPFHWRLKQMIDGSYEKQPLISIVPVFIQEKDADRGIFSTLENLKIVLMPFKDGNLLRQRVVLINHDRNPGNNFIVYDSERLLVTNGEVGFDVSIDVPYGSILYTEGAFDTLRRLSDDYTDDQLDAISAITGFNDDGMLTLDDETNVLSKIKVINTLKRELQTLNDANLAIPAEAYSLTIHEGSSKKDLDYCERYIHNEEAYRVLEFQQADFLYCEGCFADIEPVNLSGKKSAYALNWASENLGYLWKYVFNGRSYSYMFRTANPFSDSLVATTYTNDKITYNFSNNERKLGDLLNLVELHLHPKAVGTNTSIETFSNEKGLIECHVDFASDLASNITDAHSLTEAEYIAYTNAGFTADNTTDVYGWTLADFNSLAAENGTDFVSDGDATLPRDTRTGLIEAQHNALMGNAVVTAYLGGAYAADANTDAKGRTEAEFNAYKEALFLVTITLQTPFCSLQFSASKYDADQSVPAIRLRPSLIDGNDDVSRLLREGSNYNNDPFVISHWDMAQDEIPEGVISRLISFPENGATTATLVAVPLEVREVSFLHQVAQAAYQASSNYNHTIGIVPTTPPPAKKAGLSAWAGQPAEYEVKDDGTIVVTKDGTGILGNKLLAGALGYRDDAAFGGIILTNGEDLPNNLPYGIDDTDEALDPRSNPIDIGKHLLVVGSWGYVTNPKTSFESFGGKRISANQTNYPVYVNAGPSIAQILADLAPGNEPIGPVNGVVSGFNNRMQTPRSVLNNLAALRICMIGQDSVISSIYTAALRTSDYTKISSIISANEILKRVRQTAAPVLGQALDDATINSLDTTMLGLSNALKNDGYAQACRIRLSASRLDRINGVLNARVSFVPPFSLETINVNMTLEAPSV